METDDKNHKGGRRKDLERRNYSYTSHIPERRSGNDRRVGEDRRRDNRKEKPSNQNEDSEQSSK
jgi:hypothetical protein